MSGQPAYRMWPIHALILLIAPAQAQDTEPGEDRDINAVIDTSRLIGPRRQVIDVDIIASNMHAIPEVYRLTRHGTVTAPEANSAEHAAATVVRTTRSGKNSATPAAGQGEEK